MTVFEKGYIHINRIFGDQETLYVFNHPSEMIRVAEAALQIMGKAGDHQVPKTVNQAMASGFGGTMWTVLFLLTRDTPW